MIIIHIGSLIVGIIIGMTLGIAISSLALWKTGKEWIEEHREKS